MMVSRRQKPSDPTAQFLGHPVRSVFTSHRSQQGGSRGMGTTISIRTSKSSQSQRPHKQFLDRADKPDCASGVLAEIRIANTTRGSHADICGLATKTHPSLTAEYLELGFYPSGKAPHDKSHTASQC